MIKVVYIENTACGGGSSISLALHLKYISRSHAEPVLLFGGKNNDQWMGEKVLSYLGYGLINCEHTATFTSLRGLFNLIKFLLYAPLEFLSVRRTLKKLKPDLVHINSGQSLAAGIAAASLKIPVIWHVRELVRHNLLGRLQSRIYMACSSRIIVVSHAVLERLPSVKSSGKAVVMHNGIDLVQAHNSKHRTYRAEWGFTNDDFLVLLLGNVSKAKGYLFLAEVAERTRENERIKYVMAGDYEDKSCGAVHSIFRRFYRKMKNVPVNRNPEKHIILERWAGFIDRGTAIFCGHVDPYRAIATSDLVVCPSQEPESFGRTIIEAYAMACPVIAMSVGGGEQELIESSSEGLLLQMDANEWAERLKELSDNTILMNKFRLNAARKALQFNSEQLSKRIMNLYEDILSG